MWKRSTYQMIRSILYLCSVVCMLTCLLDCLPACWPACSLACLLLFLFLLLVRLSSCLLVCVFAYLLVIRIFLFFFCFVCAGGGFNGLVEPPSAGHRPCRKGSSHLSGLLRHNCMAVCEPSPPVHARLCAIVCVSGAGCCKNVCVPRRLRTRDRVLEMYLQALT